MSAWDDLFLNKLLVRYADLIPDGAGLMAAPAVGLANRQEFSIVGGTTAHAGAAHVAFAVPSELTVVGVRQSFGGTAAPQFRDAAEAFIAHAGRWRIALGPNGEGEGVELSPGDVLSVPPGAYRALEKLDDEPGFLFIVRGAGDHPPAPAAAVFASSSEAGPHVLTAGRWIDCSSGWPVLKEAVRDGAVADGAMSPAAPPGAGPLTEYAVGAASIAANPESPLAADGVEEAGVISPRATRDHFEPGPIKGRWPHGFSLRCLTLKSGAYIPMHSRGEGEILLLQEGTLEVSWAEGAIMMGAGDTLRVPMGLTHALRNTTSQRTRVFAVRASEDPAMPLFQSMPLLD